MEFFIIAILTLLNGFFALSEIALVSVKKSKIEHLAEKGNKRAKIILELLENPENFLSSVQVGITLIGIISGAYGGSAIASTLARYIEQVPLFAAHADGLALTIAIAGITYFSIVIGELVPKSIAMNQPEKFALFSVPILRYFTMLVYPFVILLSVSTTFILKVLRIPIAPEEKLSEEELISLLKNASRQGVLDKDESKIHHNIFSFGDQTAKSIITHRNMVEWIDIHDSKEEIFKKIQESVHSKFVVADGTIDTIVGILKIRDFLESMEKNHFDLKKILSKPIIVAENTPAIELLNTFKKKKEYIAIVIDEFGGTEGIITLHDLMEVIIGDLPDEDEETEGNIITSSKGQFLVNGRTLIYEINQYFQEEVIEDKSTEYTTLSGYILSALERLPRTGEKFVGKSGYEFQVVDMDGVRIDKVMMRKSQTEEIED